MRILLTILTGLALTGNGISASAQARASGNQRLEQLFSTVDRATVVSDDGSKTTDSKAEDRKILMQAFCEKIMRKRIRLIYLNDHNEKMKLQLRGIYARGPALYFLLRMNNRSAMNYPVEAIRFFITDPDGRKMTAMRQKELRPVYVYDSTTLVRGYSRLTNVIVLPRFSLPPGKRLLIEVLEKNGNSHLQLLTTRFTMGRVQAL